MRPTALGVLPARLDVAVWWCGDDHEQHPFPRSPEGDAQPVGGLHALDSRLHGGPIVLAGARVDKDGRHNGEPRAENVIAAPSDQT